MKRRTWFQNWLLEAEEDPDTDVQEVAGEVLKADAEIDLSLEPQEEVLNTGYTLEEFDREIKNRARINRKLQSQVDRHKNKYQEYRDDAVEASGNEKANLYVKAKEQQIKHDTKQKFLDKLAERKLFLQSLRLQHVFNELENPADSVDGIEIDIGELPVDEIAEAIHESTDSDDEAEFMMTEIERELDLGTDLDLSDIKQDVEEEEAARIDEGTSELEQGIDSEIDQEIEAKLAELDDEFNNDGE